VFVTKLDTDGQLSYSTYIGGGYDYGFAIAVDNSGSAYITGRAALDYPVLNAFQAQAVYGWDAFVTNAKPMQPCSDNHGRQRPGFAPGRHHMRE
jgi:hypothetical protein